MPDHGQLSPEQKEQLRWLVELHQHSKAKLKTKVWNLAAHLGVWRIVRTGLPPELAKEPLLVEIAKGFERVLAASGNGGFLRDVAEASDALEKGDFFKKLNIQTQALIIHEELRQERGRPPTTHQVLKRLEEILGTLSERQQDRVQEAVAPLKQK
jgi:hypothetical protein